MNLYYRFLYRPIQQLLHRFNLHYMPPCYPDGDTLLWCQWCGIRDMLPRSTNEIAAEMNARRQDA